MNMQGMSTEPRPAVTSLEMTNTFLRGVYNWMAAGLGITAVLAWLATKTSAASFFFTSTGTVVFFVCAAVELGMVWYLSARINKLSAGFASGMFLVYSALSGITLAPMVMVYTPASVVQAFVATCGMFAAMSVYGLFTKRDLAGLGSFCTMALFGLIIAMVVNLFMQSSALSFGISCIGVLVFTGLTAYDTQLLKEMGERMPADDPDAVRRGTILGALKLYLDFINLFIMLLRLIGDRR